MMRPILGNYSRGKYASQKGVTLLVTILIMSGLIIIAMTVAALGITELRSSRAYVYTEPAIGAAQSGAENGLWAIKRSGTSAALSTNCEESPSVTGVTSSTAKGTYCQDKTSPAFVTIRSGSPYTFFLTDPEDVNGDIDLCGEDHLTPYYKSLTVKYPSNTTVSYRTPNVHVDIVRLDGTSVRSGTLYYTFGYTTLTNLVSCPSASDNRMMVTLTSEGDDVSVELTAEPNGLASFPTLNSTGCSGTTISSSSVNCKSELPDLYSRKLQVSVPQ